jgi:hypothetical protein
MNTGQLFFDLDNITFNSPTLHPFWSAVTWHRFVRGDPAPRALKV